MAHAFFYAQNAPPLATPLSRRGRVTLPMKTPFGKWWAV